MDDGDYVVMTQGSGNLRSGNLRSGNLRSASSKSHPDTPGWIILCVILTLIIIGLIIAWAFSLNSCENQCQGCTCYGPFGVQANIDALEINVCGTSKQDPCIFNATTSLVEAEEICNVYKDICKAFTYNARTTTMKIVLPDQTFTASDLQTNLFVRQSGKI